MPQSLANVLIHLIFSTKNRAPSIDPAIECELYPYLASICRNHNSPTHAIGGTENHVHIACSLSRTTTISRLLEEVKRSSSKWMKTKGAKFSSFAWQNGYAAFSIGQSQLDAVRAYIGRQREHHTAKSFEDELRRFLTRYQVAYDERYAWD